MNSVASLYKFLTEAEKASLRAKDLTQQLLTLARGGAPIKTQTSLVEFIKESAGFALTGSKVRCEFLLPADLWPVKIDVGQMNQVLNNLLINAQQAMPTGGHITIQGENLSINAEGSNQHSNIQAGDYAKISVRDQGIGISEHDLSRIFDPYFTTKDKGNGLGLATTYAIVRNHGGYITVESELGVGTKFSLYVVASSEAVLARKDETTTLQTGHGKVLVMDDEPSIRNLLQSMLSYLGYTVEVTCDGVEAIELYKRAEESDQPFVAAIMDLTIPGGMGGKEAVRKLQEINPRVRAIVSSGYSTDSIMGDFRTFGFNGVITKPYNMVEVSRSLHEVLSLMNE